MLRGSGGNRAVAEDNRFASVEASEITEFGDKHSAIVRALPWRREP